MKSSADLLVGYYSTDNILLSRDGKIDTQVSHRKDECKFEIT